MTIFDEKTQYLVQEKKPKLNKQAVFPLVSIYLAMPGKITSTACFHAWLKNQKCP